MAPTYCCCHASRTSRMTAWRRAMRRSDWPMAANLNSVRPRCWPNSRWQIVWHDCRCLMEVARCTGILDAQVRVTQVRASTPTVRARNLASCRAAGSSVAQRRMGGRRMVSSVHWCLSNVRVRRHSSTTAGSASRGTTLAIFVAGSWRRS